MPSCFCAPLGTYLVLKLLMRAVFSGEREEGTRCAGSVSSRNAAPMAAHHGLQRKRDQDQTERRLEMNT